MECRSSIWGAAQIEIPDPARFGSHKPSSEGPFPTKPVSCSWLSAPFPPKVGPHLLLSFMASGYSTISTQHATRLLHFLSKMIKNFFTSAILGSAHFWDTLVFVPNIWLSISLQWLGAWSHLCITFWELFSFWCTGSTSPCLSPNYLPLQPHIWLSVSSNWSCWGQRLGIYLKNLKNAFWYESAKGGPSNPRSRKASLSVLWQGSRFWRAEAESSGLITSPKVEIDVAPLAILIWKYVYTPFPPFTLWFWYFFL